MKPNTTVAIAALCFTACVHSVQRPVASPTSFRADVSGSGRPVIFIPDLGVSGEVWDTTVAHLGNRVESHVLTLPGFAGQPALEGPLLPQVKRELTRYLREHQLKGAVIVGHMYGAALAYSLGVDEPELVGGIVVIDVLPCQSALGEPDEPRAQALEEAKKIHDMLAKRPPNVDQQERRLRTMMTDPARARKMAEEGVRSSSQAVADSYLELMQMDWRSQVRSLRARALVVVTDLTYPPEAWSEVEASWHRQIDPIPNHQMVAVRGAHHYVMFDKPTEWFAALDQFLGTLPALE